MVLDIAGSARWHNQDQLRARATLAAAIQSAVRAAGVTMADLAIEDRGDGMILLIPPTVSKVDILDPIVPRLAERLHRHNATAESQRRIQLRVAIHAGEIHRDPHGWVGTDLITACRLVNAEPLYQLLDRNPRADLVLLVSDLIYQGVVRHGYRGIDPADYTQVNVVAKEVRTLAWLRTPHAGLLPVPAPTGTVVRLERDPAS
jgi:hypothetical protein